MWRWPSPGFFFDFYRKGGIKESLAVRRAASNAARVPETQGHYLKLVCCNGTQVGGLEVAQVLCRGSTNLLLSNMLRLNGYLKFIHQTTVLHATLFDRASKFHVFFFIDMFEGADERRTQEVERRQHQGGF